MKSTEKTVDRTACSWTFWSYIWWCYWSSHRHLRWISIPTGYYHWRTTNSWTWNIIPNKRNLIIGTLFSYYIKDLKQKCCISNIQYSIFSKHILKVQKYNILAGHTVSHLFSCHRCYSWTHNIQRCRTNVTHLAIKGTQNSNLVKSGQTLFVL
jgi:hypothetical protein